MSTSPIIEIIERTAAEFEKPAGEQGQAVYAQLRAAALESGYSEATFSEIAAYIAQSKGLKRLYAAIAALVCMGQPAYATLDQAVKPAYDLRNFVADMTRIDADALLNWCLHLAANNRQIMGLKPADILRANRAEWQALIDARWEAATTPDERDQVIRLITNVSPVDLSHYLIEALYSGGTSDILIAAIARNATVILKEHPAERKKILGVLLKELNLDEMPSDNLIRAIRSMCQTPQDFKPLIDYYEAILHDPGADANMKIDAVHRLDDCLSGHSNLIAIDEQRRLYRLILRHFEGKPEPVSPGSIQALRNARLQEGGTCTVCGVHSSPGNRIIACLECKKFICENHSTGGDFSKGRGLFCSKRCWIDYNTRISGSSNPRYW